MWWFSGSKDDVQWWWLTHQTAGQGELNDERAQIVQRRRQHKNTSGSLAARSRRFSQEITSPDSTLLRQQDVAARNTAEAHSKQAGKKSKDRRPVSSTDSVATSSPGPQQYLRHWLWPFLGSEEPAAQTVAAGGEGCTIDKVNEIDSDSTDDDDNLDPSEPLFFAVVRFAFRATQEDELSLDEGQLVAVLEISNDGWWLGKKEQDCGDPVIKRDSRLGDQHSASCRRSTGDNTSRHHCSPTKVERIGWFPSSHVHAIREPTRGEEPDCQPNTTNTFGKQVPVALVAPYVSLVGPLDETSRSTTTGSTTVARSDRCNMNFNRNSSVDSRYDHVTNASWPRSAARGGSHLVAGLEPVIETVVARFAFQARGAGELSFGKGERLDILDRPEDDPDWLMAANCVGQRGLVPINHLQDIDTTSTTTTTTALIDAQGNRTIRTAARDGIERDVIALYSHQPWYFGAISRAYADVLLNAFGSVGDFLVRDSETSVGDFSLTARGQGCNRHFQIHVDGIEDYRIGHRKFYHLSDLVEYYKRIPIYTSPQGYKLYLVKPFKKP